MWRLDVVCLPLTHRLVIFSRTAHYGDECVHHQSTHCHTSKIAKEMRKFRHRAISPTHIRHSSRPKLLAHDIFLNYAHSSARTINRFPSTFPRFHPQSTSNCAIQRPIQWNILSIFEPAMRRSSLFRRSSTYRPETPDNTNVKSAPSPRWAISLCSTLSVSIELCTEKFS